MVCPHLVFLVNVCVCDREREHRAGLRIDTWGIQSHKSSGCSCDTSCLFICPLCRGDVILYYSYIIYCLCFSLLMACRQRLYCCFLHSLSFIHSLTRSLTFFSFPSFPHDKEAFIGNTCILMHLIQKAASHYSQRWF